MAGDVDAVVNEMLDEALEMRPHSRRHLCRQPQRTGRIADTGIPIGEIVRILQKLDSGLDRVRTPSTGSPTSVRELRWRMPMAIQTKRRDPDDFGPCTNSRSSWIKREVLPGRAYLAEIARGAGVWASSRPANSEPGMPTRLRPRGATRSCICYAKSGRLHARNNRSVRRVGTTTGV